MTAPITPGTKSDRVSRAPRRRYLEFLGLAALAVVALLGIGYLPTRRLAGDAALPAMLGGCLISLTAAAVAALVLVGPCGDTPTVRIRTAFRAMVVRLTVAALLGLAAALSGQFARMPLLFWLATTYVILLPLEVKLAIQS